MRIMGIVLAAGQGTRMKSKLYKVLHAVCGKPMVGHVVEQLRQAAAERVIVVVGHGADAVQSYLGEQVEYALQAEQLGTGHAVLQAEALLGDEEGMTMVLCGDTPLLTATSLNNALVHHQRTGAACTLITAEMDNPTGYGRVIRDDAGRVQRIVEQKDCNEAEDKVREINTGTYVFDNQKLFAALKKVTNNNMQGEYYLTDVIEILRGQGEVIEGCVLQDEAESIGVNDRAALAEAEQWMRRQLARKHMLNGVTLIDPLHTYIDADVEIGADTVIYPGTRLAGNTVIGSSCVIGPNTEIENSRIGDEVTIKQSVILEAVVKNTVTIGPYAYVRPGSVIETGVKIGDFVEIKNSHIGAGSKVPHLSYVGDSDIGRNVNIGCGVITANYDGVNKHRTVVQEGAFIGSNTTLIAPLEVGKDAYVVAGSTITKDVPENGMAIARERQTNKPGYAEILRKKFKQSE